jgi:hypothetical protein
VVGTGTSHEPAGAQEENGKVFSFHLVGI